MAHHLVGHESLFTAGPFHGRKCFVANASPDGLMLKVSLRNPNLSWTKPQWVRAGIVRGGGPLLTMDEIKAARA
jgi:hypothetical protein